MDVLSAANDLLTFELDGRRCALPAEAVLEVHRVVAIAPLAGAPRIVEGVVDLRGRLVPVLDVRAKLGLPPSPLALSNHLIFARLLRDGGGERTVALRVERALAVVRVPPELIEDPRPIAGPVLAAGVAKLADGLVVIHDLRAFLSLEEALQVDAALPGGRA
jgi:purine-binding chemotaxis protein CheW